MARAEDDRRRPTAADDAKRRWRAHCASPPPDAPLVLGLAASFTADPLVPWIGARLLRGGCANPELRVGPYHQLHQLCLDPQAFFGGRPDAILVLWRLEDLVPALLDRARAGDADARSELATELARLAHALRGLRSRFDGALVVSTSPRPSAGFDAAEVGDVGAAVELFEELSLLWIRELRSIDRVQILDLHGLLSEAGYEECRDPRKAQLYRQPFREAFLDRLGAQAARILLARTTPPKKCIVLDCDGTLWGGIVGEDGVGGIELGDDFPGRAFRDFQRALLRLHARGVLLAVASRNEEEDVLRVFDSHDAMLLRREHVSAFEVHWRSKVESLRRIAETLHIGTDSLVFVDDSGKEIAEVEARLPEVACFQVPPDVARLPDLLRGSTLFDAPALTAEDRQRTQMLHAERSREQLGAEVSEEEFLRSLELEVEVFPVEAAHVARVTQLVNKTNQWNLTTIRRSHEEVQALADDPDTLLLAMKVGDRFGEYGLVGVAVVRPDGPGLWTIDTLLLSCRVLGRGAETAFLAMLGRAVAERGGRRLAGHYRQTPKNGQVAKFYPEHGFARDEAENAWVASTDDLPAPPAHVRVTLSSPAERG